MDTKDELIKAFEFIGQTVNDQLIDKCLALCSKYDIMIEDFVDQWSAFTITNLKNSPITLDGILLMERKELSKLTKNSFNSSNTTSKEAAPKSSLKNVNLPYTPENRDVEISTTIPSIIETQNTEKEATESDVPAQSYSERIDSGEVVATYGSKHDFVHGDIKATVNIFAKSNWYNPEKFRYLHATQLKVSTAFSDAIDSLVDIIYMRNNLGSKNEVNVSKSNDIICGRIRSEDFGKLNSNTVKLESSYLFNGAKVTTLNISKTNKFSLFPGQVVAVQGLNAVGNSFIAQEFFADGLSDFHQECPNVTENLQIVVAAGPFTASDNFVYEPLQDLLKYVVEAKPKVLILLGPFIDITHSTLVDMTETFETYFNGLIDTIMDCFKFEIQVVLVPSTKDAQHYPVYPTPPYRIERKYPNLTCAPNPCILNIDGILIGTSTMDILFHLTKEEISRKPQNTDRMARLASHLLNQRSFYPLYPSNKDAVIDYRRLLNDCRMEIKPHILILPSTLRYCIRDVEGCLFINPERLVKNRVGGTFATINISPVTDNIKIVSNIFCQIRKI